MKALKRTFLCRWLLLLLPAFACSACTGESDKAEAKIFLEIRISEDIGNITRQITFRDERRDVSSMVMEANPRSGRTTGLKKVGDFGDVYLALTGKADVKSQDVQTVESIFVAAKNAGWKWEEDKLVPDDGEIGERKIYRMWK